jgi:hypothetical protein
LNLNTIRQMRHQSYGCFERSADALFELVDALCSEPQARSLPELSLSSAFRRKWGSVYEALEDGRINEGRWSAVWTAALLGQHQGPVWVSVDSSSIPRPEAETSPDRGMIYLPNLPHAKKPVSVGWQFSTVMLLPETSSSWGAILAQGRITSSQTAVGVAIRQLESLIPLLPAEVRLLADRWYATGPFLSACQRLHVGLCFVSSAIGNCIGLHPPNGSAAVEPLVKMGRSFRAASQRPGANLTKSGEAPIGRASRSRCKPGITCISDKRERSR